MKWIAAVLLFLCLAFAAGCAAEKNKQKEAGGYNRIDQETAKKMMEQDDGHILVDVRRQDEYDAGHIPGAVCIPNESIGTERPGRLPDPDQIILVYCRTGNRSGQAGRKLAALGYTNVYDFGGIVDWNGEVTTEPAS